MENEEIAAKLRQFEQALEQVSVSLYAVRAKSLALQSIVLEIHSAIFPHIPSETVSKRILAAFESELERQILSLGDRNVELAERLQRLIDDARRRGV